MEPLNLLSTKIFIPNTRPETVSRKRLLDMVNKNFRRNLILVSAPAGFGKTTLICDWIRRHKIQVAWYSLDQGDNDPAIFLSYMVAALQVNHHEIGNSSIRMLQASQPELNQILANLIKDIIQAGKELILVLEDYHLIRNEQIHSGIEFLISNKPMNLHMVIISRSDPSLPIHRYRANDRLTEIRAEHLSFSNEEAYSFFNKVMGLNLSSENVNKLNTRTEGWITGLQMAALSIRSHDNIEGFVQSFTGNNRYVMDYLLEEVISVQPENVKTFLLKTSILERFSGELCEAITGLGNCHEILEILDRENLFIIPLDLNKSWYRYHHLFADLLRKKLGEVLPDLTPTIHRKASKWFAERDYLQAAINHSLAAKDWQSAALLVEQTFHDRMKRGEDFAIMFDRLDALPEEMICSSPSLCIMYAWMHAIMYHLDDAETYLNHAAKLEDANLTDDLQMQMETIRSEIARIRGDLGYAIKSSRDILNHISPGPSASYVQMQNYTASTITLAWAYYLKGEMDQAEKRFRESISIGREAGSITLSLMQMKGLAQTLILQGRLRYAGEILRNALEEIKASTNTFGQLPTAAAYIYIEYGNYLRELNQLGEAYRYVRTGLDLGINRRIDGGSLRDGFIHLARIQFAQNDLEGYRNAFKEASRVLGKFFEIPGFKDPLEIWSVTLAYALLIHPEMDETTEEKNLLNDWISCQKLSGFTDASSIFDEQRLILQARCHLYRAEYQIALSLLDHIIESAHSGNRQERIITAHILQAIVFEASGDSQTAIQSIKQALEMAAEEKYLRIFLDEGEAVSGLLKRLPTIEFRDSNDGTARKLNNYLKKLIHSFEVGKSPASSNDLTDPLSEREMDVLILLSTGLSNHDIAEKLFISKDTVKSHLKNINLKLNTGDRKHAVEKARKLGLL